jgi:hypothetical protein
MPPSPENGLRTEQCFHIPKQWDFAQARPACAVAIQFEKHFFANVKAADQEVVSTNEI